MPVTIRPKSLQALIPYVFLCALSLIVLLPVMGYATERNTDFGTHIMVAEDHPDRIKHVAHVLFHAVYRLIKHWLPEYEKSDIALLAIMVFMLPVPMIIFSVLRRKSAGLIPAPGILLLSVGLTVMSPITFWSTHLMVGYISPIVYHNPTLIALRLFAIPISLLALRVFSNASYRDANHRLCTLLFCASLLLISTLAKPSYTFVLIPSCCVFAAWRTVRGYQVDWKLLVLGICTPGTLMLGLLYLIAYANNTDGSSISFGVFVFIRYWVPDWLVPIQFLLSIAFPLSVYLLFLGEARKHLYLNLSWTVLAVSVFVKYGLYESGPRIAAGNFVWSSYIAAFVLMFASVFFLVQQYVRCRPVIAEAFRSNPSRLSLKFSIAFVLFCSHVFFGISYYIRYMTGVL